MPSHFFGALTFLIDGIQLPRRSDACSHFMSTDEMIWRANHVDKINIRAVRTQAFSSHHFRVDFFLLLFFCFVFFLASYLFVAFRINARQIKTNVTKITRIICDRVWVCALSRRQTIWKSFRFIEASFAYESIFDFNT